MDPLIGVNAGECYTGKEYNIPCDSEGNSELTGEKDNFTCVDIEVYQITQ